MRNNSSNNFRNYFIQIKKLFVKIYQTIPEIISSKIKKYFNIVYYFVPEIISEIVFRTILFTIKQLLIINDQIILLFGVRKFLEKVQLKNGTNEYKSAQLSQVLVPLF